MSVSAQQKRIDATFFILKGGVRPMSNINEAVETGQCPCCRTGYEIVALKFHLFRPASALMVCMTCGMVQSDFND